jgi:DNA-binding LytR/AlgR family response regulator
VQTNVLAFDRVKDAYECLMEKEIDLFVVDIILDKSVQGDSSGLRFVDNVRRVTRYAFTPVIFVTSLEDSRLYTYEKLHCYSFVEKPFDPEYVRMLMERCLEFPGREEMRKTLYFRKDGIVLALDQEEIIYAEVCKHKLLIHTTHKDMITLSGMTLTKFLEDAEGMDFIRCSRHTVVNKRYVRNVDVTNGMIGLKNDYGSIEIGITYKKIMREEFC